MMVGLMAALIVSQPHAAPVLTLEQAFKETEQNNLDLKVANAKLAQAREIASKAWAGYLPQISVGGSYTRNDSAASLTLPTGYYLRDVDPATSGAAKILETANGPASFDASQPVSADNPVGSRSNTIMYPSGMINFDLQKKEQVGAQVQVSQALVVPALWAGIRNAYLVGDIAELSVKHARREVLFAVAQIYYGIVGLKETAVVQERLLQNTADHEKDAGTRFASGSLPRIGLLRAQIDRSKAEQDLLRTQNSLAGLKLALNTLLAREADFDVTAPEQQMVFGGRAELEDAAVADRLDLQAARLSTTLAGRSHSAVFYKYLPNIIAQAQYRIANIAGFTGKNDAWAVSLLASWNILDGGLRESELRESESKLVEAQASERSVELKAREEVKRALLDLQSAETKLKSATEMSKLAGENMQLVNVSYESGMATPIEVSDATTQHALAELGVVGETLNAKLAALRLLKAAGAFDPQ